jgi:hypothetical protein
VLRTIFAVGWILNGTLTLDLGFSPHPSFCFAKMPPRANLLANFAGLFTVPRRGRLWAASPLAQTTPLQVGAGNPPFFIIFSS